MSRPPHRASRDERLRRWVGCVIAAALAVGPAALGCRGSRSDTPRAPIPGSESRPHFGPIMLEIAQRFEILGRAAQSRRYELAYFEVEELAEAFREELPRAIRPHDVDAETLRAQRVAFATEALSTLRTAVRSHDATAITAAIARAAALCNGCHQATGRGFIEVPSEPGASIPRTTP